MRTLGRFLLTLFIAASGLAAGTGLLAAQARSVLRASGATEPTSLLALSELSQRSVVYARDGSLLAVLHAEENRSPVSIDQVPQHVIDAILDVEDERFWQHDGVDVSSMLRALVHDVEAGEIVQGGSTVTQQLVKNALLTPERDLERKIKEAVLAVRLEGKLSKRDILGQYLNTVYFGNGAYGVQAAAETYFGVGAAQLTTGQAALLAGLIRNPVGYDPVKNPAAAKARRQFALGRMVEQGHLSPADAERLGAEPLPLAAKSPLPQPNDYFVEEVKQRLLDDARLGETPQERYNALFKGGLQIHTTLDPGMQKVAEEKVRTGLPDTKGKFTAALVTAEPGTGAVRAMVAGPGFEQAKYNLVTQGRRQPGSSWKPFVLMAALEAGYGPNDSVSGTMPCPVNMGRGVPVYNPGNYEGSAGAVTSITNATAKSMNCAFVRLGMTIGLEKIVEVVKRLGINGEVDPYPAMTLGTEEVTPLEMASAYGVFANDGMRHAPYFVEKLVDRHGKVVFEGPDKGEQAVSVQNARLATQVLRAPVESGTGTRARLPGRPVAGKTGTSQEWQNAWFVGYTPQLVTAVWMGSPVGNVPMRSVGGTRVTGGSFPARIWGAYMREVMDGMPVVPFAAPDPKQIPKTKSVRPPKSVGGGAAPKRESPRRADAPPPAEEYRPPAPLPEPPPPANP